MKHNTIFVCGTDTEVGKTLVTGALCAHLQKRGIRAGAYKPLESGCSPDKGLRRHLRRADTEFLKKMASMPETLDEINPYYFKEPLAPGIAARRERKKVSFLKIQNSLARLQKKYDLLFVEGAGGLVVPINGLKTNVDLIKYLKLPVLLVSRLGLGTINHTLLTLKHLKQNRIKTIGVILNQMTPKLNTADKTNPDVLSKYGAPILGVFPYIKNHSKKNLASASKKISVMPALRNYLGRASKFR